MKISGCALVCSIALLLAATAAQGDDRLIHLCIICSDTLTLLCNLLLTSQRCYIHISTYGGWTELNRGCTIECIMLQCMLTGQHLASDSGVKCRNLLLYDKTVVALRCCLPLAVQPTAKPTAAPTAIPPPPKKPPTPAAAAAAAATPAAPPKSPPRVEKVPLKSSALEPSTEAAAATAAPTASTAAAAATPSRATIAGKGGPLVSRP